jgi:hypothetical protein
VTYEVRLSGVRGIDFRREVFARKEARPFLVEDERDAVLVEPAPTSSSSRWSVKRAGVGPFGISRGTTA